MPAPEEARRALSVVTSTAVATATNLLAPGSPEQTRSLLLEAVPGIVSYYSDGSSALAADHYDDLRDAAGAPGSYTAEPIAELREERIRVGVLWSVDPLFLPDPDDALAASRLSEIVQYETARPFRQTITTNSRRDPSSVGWTRITSGGCKFCSLLAARGAVYRAETARFAAHPHCGCTAAPVFDGQTGTPASAMQYIASLRTRSPAQRQALREYLAAMP